MYYVYILKSINFPDQIYIGFSSDLEKRLSNHNDGKVIYTRKYLPWEVMTYTTFKDKNLAQKFEKYLKSGSGRSFINRHFFTN